jgi:hypothetical protein
MPDGELFYRLEDGCLVMAQGAIAKKLDFPGKRWITYLGGLTGKRN